MSISIRQQAEPHRDLAEMLYQAVQQGYGQYASDPPRSLPVAPWAALPKPTRERLLKRAAAFDRLGHLPLDERLYTAYWHAHPVVGYRAAKPWIRELWGDYIAAAFIVLNQQWGESAA
jgi:hypothetical protein